MQLSFVFSIHYTHKQHPEYQRQSSSHIDEISVRFSVGGGTGGLGSLFLQFNLKKFPYLYNGLRKSIKHNKTYRKQSVGFVMFKRAWGSSV